MITSCIALVLTIAFQVIFGLDMSQEGTPHIPPPPPDPKMTPPHEKMPLYVVNQIPRRCWQPPAGINVYECCPIPRMYPDVVMESCGIERARDLEANEKPPPVDTECKKGTCLMMHSNLLRANKSIDIERLNEFIDQFAYQHPEFTQAILVAKKICAKEGIPAGPPNLCQPDKLFFCMNAQILWNCNLRVEHQACTILKEHMDECRPYYAKPKSQENVTISN